MQIILKPFEYFIDNFVAMEEGLKDPKTGVIFYFELFYLSDDQVPIDVYDVLDQKSMTDEEYQRLGTTYIRKDDHLEMFSTFYPEAWVQTVI